MRKNYAFDFAASIESDKPFDDLTVSELAKAMRERLDRVEEDNEIEAFGFYDEYDVEE